MIPVFTITQVRRGERLLLPLFCTQEYCCTRLFYYSLVAFFFPSPAQVAGAFTLLIGESYIGKLLTTTKPLSQVSSLPAPPSVKAFMFSARWVSTFLFEGEKGRNSII